MNPIRHSLLAVRSRGVCWAAIRPFSSIHPIRACHKEPSSNVPQEGKTCKSQSPNTNPSSTPLSTLRLPFWTCKSTWRRAGINTLRCLVGCTAGDFSALWILQTYYPELGMSSIMAMSSEPSSLCPAIPLIMMTPANNRLSGVWYHDFHHPRDNPAPSWG